MRARLARAKRPDKTLRRRFQSAKVQAQRSIDHNRKLAGRYSHCAPASAKLH
jgi:hypothetical protein